MVSMEHIIMNKNHFLLSSVRRNLKNILLVCGVFFLLGFLLMHPAESLVCAKAGMTLWLNTLIPTLLPFIILTGILTRIDNIQKFYPLWSLIFVFCWVSAAGAVTCFYLVCCVDTLWVPNWLLICMNQIKSAKKKLCTFLLSVITQVLLLSLHTWVNYA